MKTEYSRRALVDLSEISTYYETHASRRAAVAIAERIEAVVRRIAIAPQSARRVAKRPDVRVVPLLRYPYKMFYTIAEGRILILHVRHTSRRDWTGE